MSEKLKIKTMKTKCECRKYLRVHIIFSWEMLIILNLISTRAPILISSISRGLSYTLITVSISRGLSYTLITVFTIS